MVSIVLVSAKDVGSCVDDYEARFDVAGGVKYDANETW